MVFKSHKEYREALAAALRDVATAANAWADEKLNNPYEHKAQKRFYETYMKVDNIIGSKVEYDTTKDDK